MPAPIQVPQPAVGLQLVVDVAERTVPSAVLHTHSVKGELGQTVRQAGLVHDAAVV